MLTLLEKQARERYFPMRDGAQVRVLDFNLGPEPAERTLFLVPGFATVFQSWQEAVQLLSPDFRILYFESREKASSILPGRRPGRGVTLHAMALDIKEVVEQMRLNEAPCFALASSTGSTILFEALSSRWLRPAGAILVGPLVRPRISPVAAFLTSCTPMALKNLAMPFYRAYMRVVYVNRKRNPEQYAKYVRAAEEVHLPKIYRLLREMVSYDCSEMLSRITIPCLLAGASTDNMHALTETKRIQTLLPRASLIDFGSNEAAHGKPLVDALRAFVAQVESNASNRVPPSIDFPA